MKVHPTIDLLFNDMWNNHNASRADELFSESFKIHYSDDVVTDINDFKGLLKSYFQGIPDIHHEIKDYLQEEKKIVTRWYGSGTHSGLFYEISPTGKPFHYSGITIFLLNEKEKISHAWVASDIAEQTLNLKNLSN